MSKLLKFFGYTKRPVDGEKTSAKTFIEPLLYLLPFFIIIGVFTLYPMINVILMSFKEGFRYASGSYTSIGINNYEQIFADDKFKQALLNTTIYVLIVVPVSTALSIIFATLLNQKVKGIAIFQTAYFLPMVTSTMAVGLAWKYMFNTNFGVINSILSWIGMGKVNWLLDPSNNMAALIIMGIWNMMPFTIILLLSGLQNIDPKYYTAAKVDGASSLRIFFRITVPLLLPTIGLCLIVNMMSAFKVLNDLFPLFSGKPGVAYNLYTVVYYIYDQFYVKWKLGKAAAAAMVLFLIIFIFTKIQLAMQKKWKHY